MKMDDTSLFYRDLSEIVATDPVDADAKVKFCADDCLLRSSSYRGLIFCDAQLLTLRWIVDRRFRLFHSVASSS